MTLSVLLDGMPESFDEEKNQVRTGVAPRREWTSSKIPYAKECQFSISNDEVALFATAIYKICISIGARPQAMSLLQRLPDTSARTTLVSWLCPPRTERDCKRRQGFIKMKIAYQQLIRLETFFMLYFGMAGSYL